MIAQLMIVFYIFQIFKQITFFIVKRKNKEQIIKSNNQIIESDLGLISLILTIYFYYYIKRKVH